MPKPLPSFESKLTELPVVDDDDKKGNNNVIQGPWLKPNEKENGRRPLREIKYDVETYEYFLVMGWKHPVIPHPQILAIPIRPKKTVESIMQRYHEAGGVWLNASHQKETEDGIDVEGVWYPWPPIVIEVQKRRKKD